MLSTSDDGGDGSDDWCEVMTEGGMRGFVPIAYLSTEGGVLLRAAAPPPPAPPELIAVVEDNEKAIATNAAFIRQLEQEIAGDAQLERESAISSATSNGAPSNPAQSGVQSGAIRPNQASCPAQAISQAEAGSMREAASAAKAEVEAAVRAGVEVRAAAAAEAAAMLETTGVSRTWALASGQYPWRWMPSRLQCSKRRTGCWKGLNST